MEDLVEVSPSTGPLLSVVVPVHNGMPFLKEAVSSILRETRIPIEVIIRENGSTDGTLDWLQTITDERVQIVISPQLVSAAENWTMSCELAGGDYIKLVCADDFLFDGGLKRQYDAALSEPDVVLVASPRQVVTETGKVVFRRHGLKGLHGVHLGTWALRKIARSGGNPLGEAASVLFRGDALKDSLPFSSDFPYVTDLEIYTRVLTRGQFLGLRSVDAGFRVNNSSWSKEIGAKQLQQYRDWLRARCADGSLPLNRMGRLVAEARMTMTFLARRTVTGILGFTRSSR